MTKIKPCTCRHTFQDSQYGHGMRVHNLRQKGGSGTAWKCVVCGNEKVAGKDDLKKDRKE